MKNRVILNKKIFKMQKILLQNSSISQVDSTRIYQKCTFREGSCVRKIIFFDGVANLRINL